MQRLFLFLSLFLSLSLTTPSRAQLLDHQLGELIVQLAPDREADKFFGVRAEVEDYQRIGFALNLWTVRFDHATYDENVLRDQFRRDPAVQLAQFNHLAKLRARPNDTRYADLWYFNNMGQIAGGAAGADMNLEAAWDITTGGSTPGGDEIVIAIVDNGIDLDHQDMVGNLWINTDEIAGNGIDDDGNGYVDDVHGWNTESNNGLVEGNGGHGTSVGGIAGAVGNNSRGVTGVNWRVKLMWVTDPGFHVRESEVLAAYSYALEQRRAYDRTNGLEGAYVVATNSSFGIDGGNGQGDPDDSPIWCGLYDTLGQAGIISMGAVANEPLDVEVEGDIPGRCISDHLITVTNLNAFNEKVTNAAFGLTSVDLGAYGQSVLTADLGNTYNRREGTSFSTPAVTGAAALLYSVECATWNELMESDPAAATLYLKDILLSTVKPLPALNGITVTGGVLDVGAAAEELLTRCGDCLAPTSLTVTTPASCQSSLRVNWNQIASVDDLLLRYRIAGTGSWTEVPGATAPYVIENTADCEIYEVQLIGSCGDNARPTPIVSTESSGCCRPPTNVQLSSVDGPTVNVLYTPEPCGRRHRIRYRVLDSNADWTTTLVIGDRLGLRNLEPCTDYEVQVATNCDGGVDSDFSPSSVITSFGCGSCNDANYCRPFNLNNDEEWIASVNIGNLIVNQTGANPGGYTSFGELSDDNFVRGGVYPVSLLKGTRDNLFGGQFRVWVDWNQNGRFAAEEIAFSGNGTIGPGPATGSLTIPEDAVLGLTRMRVFFESIQHRETPCPTSEMNIAEAEDYCLNITAADGCPPPSEILASVDDATGRTILRWPASAAPGGQYRLRYRLRGTTPWNEVTVSNVTVTVNLDLCGSHEVEVSSICGGTPGPGRLVYYGDDCTGTDDDRLPDTAWSVYPNPAEDWTVVRWTAGVRPATVQVFSATGRLLIDRPVNGLAELRLETGRLAAGVYLVRLVGADGRVGMRRVVH